MGARFTRWAEQRGRNMTLPGLLKAHAPHTRLVARSLWLLRYMAVIVGSLEGQWSMSGLVTG